MKNPQKTPSGKWPSPLKQFYWDLLPSKWAPQNAGIEAPEYARPEWLDKSPPDGVIEHVIRAHDQAEKRAEAAQEKAARLLNLSLTLLGVSFALATLQIKIADRSGHGWYDLTLIPIALSLIFFALSGVEALDIDRVGVFHQPGAEELFKGTSRLEIEDCGRYIASWTASKKLTALLQARAWLSRGLLALFTAALTYICTTAMYP